MNEQSRSLRRVLDHVDRVVVISLPTSALRRATISRTLETHDLQFEFFAGRDTRKATAAELDASGEYDIAARDGLSRPQLTPGEIGCALSHREVAKFLLDGSDKRFLVLEDDACLTADGLAAIDPCLNVIPDDWSLAYFGYAPMNLRIPASTRMKLVSYYPIAHFFGSAKHDPQRIRRIFRRPLNSHWMRAGWFNNAHAYAIDRRAAEFIVKSQTPVLLEADVVLGHLVRFSGLSAICQKTPLFDQMHGIPSTIGARPSWK